MKKQMKTILSETRKEMDKKEREGRLARSLDHLV